MQICEGRCPLIPRRHTPCLAEIRQPVWRLPPNCSNSLRGESNNYITSQLVLDNVRVTRSLQAISNSSSFFQGPGSWSFGHTYPDGAARSSKHNGYRILGSPLMGRNVCDDFPSPMHRVWIKLHNAIPNRSFCYPVVTEIRETRVNTSKTRVNEISENFNARVWIAQIQFPHSESWIQTYWEWLQLEFAFRQDGKRVPVGSLF